MKYKLLCTDIDGTLLNKERVLSIQTIKEIKRIKDIIPVILISSRMPKAMKHLQVDLGIIDLPLIAYNGGLIIDGNEIIESTEIENFILSDIISLTENTDIHISLYNNDSWYVPKMDYWAKREMNNTKVNPEIQELKKTLHNWESLNIGAHKIMCMGDEKEISILYSHLEKKHSNSIILYRSKPTYIEIANKNISKETAISALIKNKFANLEMKDVIAFGDNYNDLEMLKHAGMGIAVKNAKNEVKSIANEITESNIDDGVAISISKHII
jgi:hypothetical protein